MGPPTLKSKSTTVFYIIGHWSKISYCLLCYLWVSVLFLHECLELEVTLFKLRFSGLWHWVLLW